MIPRFEKLPPAVADCLQDTASSTVRAPGEKGPVVFACPCTTDASGTFLLLPVEQECTPAGRSLVRACWQSLPLTVFLQQNGKTLELTARVWRCLITGPLFAEIYKARRSICETAAVWQLAVTQWQETSLLPPVPTPQLPEGEPEYHLDSRQ